MMWCGMAWNFFERHGTLLHLGLPPFLPPSSVLRYTDPESKSKNNCQNGEFGLDLFHRAGVHGGVILCLKRSVGV